MEKTTNLLKLSLYNLSNIKLITININQGNEEGNKRKRIWTAKLYGDRYGQQSYPGIKMDNKVVRE